MKVKDDMTAEQRQAMGQLRNLPNSSNAQVTFEDKGSRFVIRNLDYQDQLILDQLTDAHHFDELPVNPTDRVISRIQNLCSKWQAELNEFHPNIISFLAELDKTSPCTVKGLVKCHKKARPDGYHDISLLLASTNTPSKPASTLFQFAIAHVFPHFESKMKDTKAILNKLLEIRKRFPNGLPANAINIGCDVVKLSTWPGDWLH
jgi:hypothetical protein